MALWREIADAPDPECCLVNLYRGGARMGLHQDKDENALVRARWCRYRWATRPCSASAAETRRGPDPKRAAVLGRRGDVRRAGAAGLSRHRPHPGRQFFAGSRRRPHQSHPETRDASRIKKRPAPERPSRRTATRQRVAVGRSDSERTHASTSERHKKTPGWGNSRALNAPLRARMPGGDNRHPRKIGSGVRAGGRAYRTKTIFRGQPMHQSHTFQVFLFQPSLQIIQRDSCEYVIVDFGFRRGRDRPGVTLCSHRRDRDIEISCVFPFIHLALNFGLIGIQRVVPETVQPGAQNAPARRGRCDRPGACPAASSVTRPASFRTLRCWETAGRLTGRPVGQGRHGSRSGLKPVEHQPAGGITKGIQTSS